MQNIFPPAAQTWREGVKSCEVFFLPTASDFFLIKKLL